LTFIYCGIDLAVKRKSAVGVLIGNRIRIYFVSTDDKILELCLKAKVTAIDSPLSYSKGFREVDREMLKLGLKVLPPSFMQSLVERAIRLSKKIKVIETHPTSSMRLIGLNWRDYASVKDEFDAVLCAITAYLYDNNMAKVVKAEDGEIYLIDKNIKIIKKNSDYIFYIPYDPFYSSIEK
jgi:predicted nuclease with RNAse H fold